MLIQLSVERSFGGVLRWGTSLLRGGWIVCALFLYPIAARAETGSQTLSPRFTVESINQLVSELYRRHLRDFVSNGPSADSLLIERGVLGKTLERIVRDDQLLTSCNPGNLYCVDRDLLFGGQDYWKDVTHTVDTRKSVRGFTSTVRGIRRGSVVSIGTLQISCENGPKIDDILDRTGASALATLESCARREHDPAELARCRK